MRISYTVQTHMDHIYIYILSKVFHITCGEIKAKIGNIYMIHMCLQLSTGHMENVSHKSRSVRK